MNSDKEPCGLDVTLEDIRKIESRCNVNINIHFNRFARVWCFDFERNAYTDRIRLGVEYLQQISKANLLDDFVSYADNFAK